MPVAGHIAPPNGEDEQIEDPIIKNDEPALFAEIAQTCACLNFRKATRAVTQLFDDHLEPSGLRSTQFVLLVAIGIYGPTSVARLAREMVMDPSTLARNLRPLERLGLAERSGGGGNRGRQISLSAAGRDTVERAVPLWRAAQSHFLERFGEAAWPDTLSLLNRAVGATRT